MKCNNCGENSHASGAIFCHKCGSKLIIKCANCGKVCHMSESIYCYRCGARLGTTNRASSRVLIMCETNIHEWVDLGLSVKWATCNVGANSPEECGDYYAWGETEKNRYTEENSSTLDVQISDISGNANYDAAQSQWGESWRMPTKAEFEELKNKCLWIWTTQNGVKGYKIKGLNANSIFLPITGARYGKLVDADDIGCYWSSTPYDDNNKDSCSLYFSGDGCIITDCKRYIGLAVRPVIE